MLSAIGFFAAFLVPKVIPNCNDHSHHEGICYVSPSREVEHEVRDKPKYGKIDCKPDGCLFEIEAVFVRVVHSFACF